MSVRGYVTLPEYQCKGKRTYESKGEAKRASRRLATHFGHRLGHYRCPHCGRFHLGHPPRQQPLET